VNGKASIVTFSGAEPISVLTIDTDGSILAAFAVLNPDKLGGLVFEPPRNDPKEERNIMEDAVLDR
jgi:hypothetical protein